MSQSIPSDDENWELVVQLRGMHDQWISRPMQHHEACMLLRDYDRVLGPIIGYASVRKVGTCDPLHGCTSSKPRTAAE